MEPEFPEEYIKYRDAVYKIAKGLGTNPRCDKEDYIAVGIASIHKSIEAYDPKKTDIPLDNWVYNQIKNDMTKEWSKNANAISGATRYIINQDKGAKEEVENINRRMMSISGWNNTSEDKLSPEEVFKVYAPTDSYDPEEQTDRMMLGECVRNAIETLPTDEKEILYRKFFNGESIVHIAKEKNIPWHKLSAKLEIAIHKVKMELIKHNIDSSHMT